MNGIGAGGELVASIFEGLEFPYMGFVEQAETDWGGALGDSGEIKSTPDTDTWPFNF